MINGHGNANKESDECYTPFYAVQPLLKYISKDKIIWCPFDEEWSAYVQLLKEEGYNVVFSHLDKGQDFFEWTPPKFDLIISNPPFSMADKVLKRLYELKKPFMVLMPLKYLQSLYRGKLFNEKGIQLLTFDKRIGYHIKGNFIKPKETNYQASAYFCWKILPKDLIVEILNKFNRKLK